MRTPSWLGIVPLFIVVWLMALMASGWPGAVAHATEAQRTRDAGPTVMLSQDDNDDDDDDGQRRRADDDNDDTATTTTTIRRRRRR